MKFIRLSSENEMIREFLTAEMSSPRFTKKIVNALKEYGASERIIRCPDADNEKENELRKLIFARYRGYGTDKGLFEKFPSNVRWEKVSLSLRDIKKIKYINYDYWVELSRGSRLASDATKNIRAGVEVFNESNKRFFEAVKSLKSGKKFPPLILVSNDKDSRIVVLEGNLRLTAYMLEPELMPKEVEALIGYSPDFVRWNLY